MSTNMVPSTMMMMVTQYMILLMDYVTSTATDGSCALVWSATASFNKPPTDSQVIAVSTTNGCSRTNSGHVVNTAREDSAPVSGVTTTATSTTEMWREEKGNNHATTLDLDQLSAAQAHRVLVLYVLSKYTQFHLASVLVSTSLLWCSIFQVYTKWA